MKSLLLMGYLLATAIAGAQNLNDGLIVYYPLDGNTLDSSDNEFHGITNAEFAEDHNGNPGKALHFNGFDQYMDFPPNRPGLKPPLPVSFAFWVKFDIVTPYFGPIVNTDFDQNNTAGAWMNLSSTNAMGINYGDAMENIGLGYRRTKIGQSTIHQDKWYYVIGIIRGPEDMDIYLDCVNDGGYYAGYGGELGYTDCQGGFGRKDANMTGPPYYFMGSIDEFRYWNRALTTEDLYVLCEEPPVAAESVEGPVSAVLLENPVNDYLTFATLPDLATTLEIIDFNGKVVLTSPPSANLNVSRLIPGVYFIRFSDDQERIISTGKFIKN